MSFRRSSIEDQRRTVPMFGFTPIANIRRRFAENGLLTAHGGMLTVVAADQAVGRVEWFKAAWGPAETSYCWTIAVAIDPRHRSWNRN